MKKDIIASDITLKYLEKGVGHPVLMLHGFNNSSEFFREQIDCFAGQLRVIALDFRGHGSSDDSTGGYNIEQLAKDVDSVIRKLGLDRPHVVCHSMGCAVVWEYVTLFGAAQPLGKLVLVDQPPCMFRQPWFDDDEARRAGSMVTNIGELHGFISMFQSACTVEVAKELVLGSFPVSPPAEDRLVVLAKESMVLSRSIGVPSLFWDNVFHDWRCRIRSIENKTLVISGAKSFVSTESQQWIASNMKSASCKVYEAGHYPFIECATDFNNDVLAFLSDGTTA